ncbi:UNVERIFIED_CONTAM: hypothetical protein Sradi_3975700 [Sesamum radiatum]|uniref:Uncharacterized protein n=1 Tax=Sesamum radiatum TaxID=300843 RepID=A0AAW2PHT8_SESRA
MEGFEAKFHHVETQAPQENLEELDENLDGWRLNAQVARTSSKSDLDMSRPHKKFLGSINCAMERSTRTNSQGIALEVTRELREHDPKHALRVQGSRPVTRIRVRLHKAIIRLW